ncbi:MAG: non-oxidative hydroxyarylic acid decarboxylases subunit D [Enterobacter hormaechei]|nr:non-oxidative hydroxyarylic acid decarboxylases subunit D [Enterobacter hormaechei]
MICPRCADEHIEVMATSPVKGVWTVYQCQHCLYTWRDTEPLRRTSREHYPEAFRMTQKDIDEARRCCKKSPVAAALTGR